MSVPSNKNLAANIAPRLFSALRDQGVIFDKFILSRSTILVSADLAGNENHAMVKKMNRKIHTKMLLLREISEER